MNNAERPRPVVNAGLRAAILALVSALITLAVLFGWLPWDSETQGRVLTNLEMILTALAVIVPVVAPILLTKRAEAKVTPLSSPMDDTGIPLVRSTDHQKPIILDRNGGFD